MDRLDGDNVMETFDINQKAHILSFPDTGEDVKVDNSRAISPEPSEALRSLPGSPGSSPSLDPSQARRRTRGVSFLSVRQSHESVREVQPQTSSPIRLAGLSRSSHVRSNSNTSSNNANIISRGRLSSPNSSSGISAIASASSSAGKEFERSIDNIPDSDKLLSTYLSQLAVKEARVGDIRVALSALQHELSEAEIDLNDFRNNGQKLADMVHRGQSRNLSELATMGRQASKRRPSSSEAQKDVLGIGKRVVDEIGTQFWSFLEDVKSATLGNVEFEGLREQSSSAFPHLASIPNLLPRPSHCDPPSPRLPPRPGSPGLERPWSPPRRQLSPKKSIQNFMRNRSPSPIHIPLSPARSATRQEIAEQHATQRLRESERLKQKLSSLELKARNSRSSSRESLISNNL